VADVREIERLVQETVAWGGQIDILIPNAGISLMRTLEQTQEADFEKTINLNVKGPYFLAQVHLPCRSMRFQTTHTAAESTTTHALRRPPHSLIYISL